MTKSEAKRKAKRALTRHKDKKLALPIDDLTLTHHPGGEDKTKVVIA